MFKVRRHREEYVDKVEEVFTEVANRTKDLSKPELKRFIEGITLTWEAWQKIRQSRPAEEREVEEIDRAEKILSEE